MMNEALLSCPFCDGEADRLDLTEEGNEGGSVIECLKCFASTKVFFGEKIGLYEAWNTRVTRKASEEDKAYKANFCFGNHDPFDDLIYEFANAHTEEYRESIYKQIKDMQTKVVLSEAQLSRDLGEFNAKFNGKSPNYQWCNFMAKAICAKYAAGVNPPPPSGDGERIE